MDKMGKFNDLTVVVGKLNPDRWAEFRDIRLEALLTESKAFRSSWEEESLFSEDIWRNKIENMLFAFDKNKPVGMIGFMIRNRAKTNYVKIYSVFM
jgi:hypothetical protein